METGDPERLSYESSQCVTCKPVFWPQHPGQIPALLITSCLCENSPAFVHSPPSPLVFGSWAALPGTAKCLPCPTPGLAAFQQGMKRALCTASAGTLDPWQGRVPQQRTRGPAPGLGHAARMAMAWTAQRPRCRAAAPGRREGSTGGWAPIWFGSLHLSATGLRVSTDLVLGALWLQVGLYGVRSSQSCISWPPPMHVHLLHTWLLISVDKGR